MDSFHGGVARLDRKDLAEEPVGVVLPLNAAHRNLDACMPTV